MGRATVIFSSFGRYYNREAFNYVLDEHAVGSAAALLLHGRGALNGNPTMIWNPSLLSKAGLDGLGIAPNPKRSCSTTT